MKKLAIILGAFFGLVLTAIVVIPLVVDVDQYRPQLLQGINERLNGRMEMGKLKLSLWGRIQINVSGLELQDSEGRKVVAVHEAFFHLPYTSILGGAPSITVSMVTPEVNVVKAKDGKLNVLGLMKEQPEAKMPPPGYEGDASGTTKIPAVVSNARIGIDLRDANLRYRDESTQAETVTRKLNVKVKDLSLSRKTEVEVSGLLEASQKETFKVSGPFKVAAALDPRLTDGKISGLGMELDADFSDLTIEAGGLFQKKKGVVARVKGEMDSIDDGMKIEKFTAKFFNAEISSSGLIKGISTETPEVDVSVNSNEIDLGPWNELIPMLKDYKLSGKARLNAFAKGPAAKLGYGADLEINQLKASAPMLKAQPVLNARIKIVTDKVEKLSATLSAPGNDIAIDGSVVSFASPRADLKITSNSLDLDQLVQLPDLKAAEVEGAAGKKAAPSQAVPEEDLDRLLDPVRSNPALAAMVLSLNASFKLIKVYDVRITDTSARVTLKDLVASVDSFSTRLFDGVVTARASVALKPARPTYSFQMGVTGFDLQKAVSSQFALFKNTLIGKLDLKMSGGGSSFNVEPAKRNLDAKGAFSVKNAKFAGIDIQKVAGEAVNRGLEKVGDKVPGLKGKRLSLGDKESRYELISADFSISGGTFRMPNFAAKSERNSGLDLKGNTTVGLLSEELKADWEIIDTWNVTGVRDISLNLNQVEVPSVLAEGKNPVVIPISVGCKYTAPCPSYGRVPEHFAKVALANTKKGATAAVREEAKTRAKDMGKKLLKGLFK